MKRFRLFTLDFDYRVNLLSIDVQDSWAPEIRTRHIRNRNNTINGLRNQFGDQNHELKLQNFIELGPKPTSVLAFHNLFFEHVRVAFVMGAYYPALTGICALGERVLNHLVITFREDYQATKEYKLVASKQSFDNWDRAIDVLSSWGCLRPETAQAFSKLKKQRNAAIHFRPETDKNHRQLALSAIQAFQQIIECQFAAWARLPWTIDNTPGETYIKKSWESDTFVRKIFLPNCKHVSYKHTVESILPQWEIDDSNCPAEIVDVSDEEFARLRRDFTAE